MNVVLNKMLELESFKEAVDLLRAIIAMQKEVGEKTNASVRTSCGYWRTNEMNAPAIRKYYAVALLALATACRSTVAIAAPPEAPGASAAGKPAAAAGSSAVTPENLAEEHVASPKKFKRFEQVIKLLAQFSTRPTKTMPSCCGKCSPKAKGVRLTASSMSSLKCSKNANWPERQATSRK